MTGWQQEAVIGDVELARVNTSRSSRRRIPIVARGRFQLVGALLFSLALPVLVRSFFNPLVYSTQAAISSIIGASIAILFGFLAWRRLYRYATVDAGSYIFWTFIPVFLSVMAVFLLFRLEYNRYVFFASMVLCLLWFLVIHFWMKRNMRMRIGIIAGGAVDRAFSFSGVDFSAIQKPFIDKQQHSLDGVVVDLRHTHPARWETFIADLTLAGIPVYHFKQLVEDYTGQVSIDHLSENSFGSLLPDLGYLKIKHMLDLFLTIVLLPLILPVMGITALAILICDGRPILFHQKRMGFRGQPFAAYKFRSMRNEPSSAIRRRGDAVTQENDPRITPLGRILRKYRIDELPQVFNILRGEMSWIGPRPEALELSKVYESRLSYYRYRHAVRPGISGWAQVNQGHVTTVDDVNEKLKYDFYYIKHISVWLDFLILLRTVKTIVSGFGSK